MSNYRISKLYLENYKLFTKKELVFTDSSLSVFDGPNGYGKTSIFDAIEFLLTGNIKRVSNNSSISKNEAFETVFIAGNPKKDVIIKAEFLSEDNLPLAIAKIIPGASKVKKGKKNNPAKLGELANTYILSSYETNEYGNEHICTQLEITQKIGSNVVEFYDLFYYIKQEDRLDFLKKNEKDRMAGINRLFKIQNEKDELTNTKRIITRLNKISDSLQVQTKELSNKIDNARMNLNEHEIKQVIYEKLLFWKKEPEIWDYEVLNISDVKKKNEIIQTIESVKLFLKNYYWFKIEQKNIWCNKWLKEKNLFRYFRFMYINWNNLGDLKTTYSAVKFLKQQEELFSNGKYTSINFFKAGEIVKAKVNIELINEIIEQINNYEKNEGKLSKALSELNQSRKILKNKVLAITDAEGNDGHCAFCGYDWKTKSKLVKQIDETTQFYNNFSDENTKLKEEKINYLNKLYVTNLQSKIISYIDEHKNIDNEIIQYIVDPNNHAEELFTQFIEGCNKFDVNIEKYFETTNTNDALVQLLINYLIASIKVLPSEYTEIQNEYNFSHIFNYYFDANDENVNKISLDKIDNKVSYIEHYYYNVAQGQLSSFKEELNKYENQSKILNEEILPQLTQYKDTLMTNIGIYQNEIIKSIEIPFYIYSGRIMQSYQGGIGILIKEPDTKESTANNLEVENETVLNSIRFVSQLRQDHDIIYTLSSGQLSSVIISFTLALNKVYCDDMFKCIFIDDPVQTMDELNIASLVELLRNEFGDRQIILSTHEDSFSRYMRYKYSKYGLKSIAITLKDLEDNI